VDLGIDGKVALVTGASKGIGRAIAAALAQEGARVAIASRSQERIDQAAKELRAGGGDVRGFVADMSDLDSLPELVRAVQDELAPVDILVTNTGGPPFGDPLGFDRKQWEEAYRNLVLAPLALVEAVVDKMLEQKWGRILNVTSSATKEPIPGLMLSNSHRLAAVGAFKTLARELARDGILVNSIAPGRIATDRIAQLRGVSVDALAGEPQPDVPVGRIGSPAEFADVAAFVCSERASYVCGQNLLVDGGLVSAI
jgi:3-oxoacyl-[acyl-carrier protein] reductase